MLHATANPTFLDSLAISTTRCETRPDASSWGEGCLHFNVTLAAREGPAWEGYYSAGSAVPLHAAQDAAMAGGAVWLVYTAKLRADGSETGSIFTPTAADVLALGATVNGSNPNLRAQIRRAYAPTLEDVLSAVLMDASGCWRDMTFRQWVEEHDGTTMTPADAYDCYQGCMKAHRWALDAFGARLEEAVEWAADQ